MTVAQDAPRARYSKLSTARWTDPAWTASSSAAQRLYVLLESQPDLSPAGVLPLTERRWAGLAPDTTASDVRGALAELERAAFVILDADTEEVCLCSYVVDDGLYKVPNGRKSVVAAVAKIVSPAIRAHVASVLGTLPPTLPPTVEGTVPGTLGPPLHLHSAPEPAPTPANAPAPALAPRTSKRAPDYDDDYGLTADPTSADFTADAALKRHMVDESIDDIQRAHARELGAT